MAKSVKRGKALVASLRAQPGVRDPEALAAYLGRFKAARKAGKSVAKAQAAAGGNGSSSGKSGGGSSRPKATTRDEVNAAPWKYSAMQYQLAHGVHQPHIGEISATQHLGLSKRGRKQYEDKRSQEWQASADKKSEWREKVRKAYDEGKINKNTPGLSDEARSAMIHRDIDRKKQDEANKQKAADEATTVRDTAQISKGEHLDHPIYNHVRVARVSKKSIRVHVLDRDGKPMKNRDGSDSTVNIPAKHIERGFLKRRKKN